MQEDYVDALFALVSVPTIGKNLLGEEDFARLQEELEPGQQAILMGSKGIYQFFTDDFIRGSEPNFVSLVQNQLPIKMRDMDFYDLATPTEALADFGENINLFAIDNLSTFDPSKPFTLAVNVHMDDDAWRSTESVTYAATYQLPKHFFTIKQIISQDTAVWKNIWYSKRFIIAVLVAYLALVLLLFFMQHEYVKRFDKRFNMKQLRLLAGVFVIAFVGLYAQGQLSVVNIFPVMQSFVHGFNLEIFLFDPVIFILWAFTFITLFIWGRGVFCGWLCPFGFIQEMLFEVGRSLGIKQIKITESVHKRLWMLKYIILVSLCFAALVSINQAEHWSQVEPFKTVITSYFITEWYFVAYAALLLFVGLFIHKFFCRYLCPLGACLSILGKLRQAEWLSRRSECGMCKLCAHKCDIGAIEQSGRVNYDECIQCFACIDIYHNNCAVTISHKKQGIALKQLTPYS